MEQRGLHDSSFVIIVTFKELRVGLMRCPEVDVHSFVKVVESPSHVFAHFKTVQETL